MRRLAAWLLLGAAAAACGACGDAGTGEGGLSLVYQLDPQPPRVGTARLTVRLVDAAGEPLTGASVAVEANMNHAGMTPTFADLAEEQPGTYAGAVEFTMGGDWFLLLTIVRPDGVRTERRLDVRGVRSS